MHTITLISDLGTNSYHIARVKAAIIDKLGNQPIVDISHDIQQENIHSAIHISDQTRKAFKGSTIHLIGVNNRTARHIAAFAEGHWYLAPDNGLLPELLQSENPSYFRLPDYIHPYFLERHYPAFVKKIVDNSFTEEYSEILDPIKMIFKKAVIRENRMQVFFSHFDSHGNAIADIKREEFYQFCGKNRFKIYVTEIDTIESISETPYHKSSGEIAVYFNQAGYLEISYISGNANRLFGLNQNGFILIDRIV